MNILVTGGASGLGGAITRRLLDEGHFVNLTYSTSEREARKLEEQHQACRSYRCDFSCTDDLDRLVRSLDEMRLDAVVNNALPSISALQFQKREATEFRDSFELSVLPVLRITQACISTFRKKRSGKIITILTSYLFNRPPIGYSDYVANKAYLLAMSKSWAVENSKFNITSNCISPSTMRTGLTADTDERVMESIAATNPLGRLVEMDEVASVVSFLLSASQQVNSINFPMNGGENVV